MDYLSPHHSAFDLSELEHLKKLDGPPPSDQLLYLFGDGDYISDMSPIGILQSSVLDGETVFTCRSPPDLDTPSYMCYKPYGFSSLQDHSPYLRHLLPFANDVHSSSASRNDSYNTPSTLHDISPAISNSSSLTDEAITPPEFGCLADISPQFIPPPSLEVNDSDDEEDELPTQEEESTSLEPSTEMLDDLDDDGLREIHSLAVNRVLNHVDVQSPVPSISITNDKDEIIYHRSTSITASRTASRSGGKSPNQYLSPASASAIPRSRQKKRNPGRKPSIKSPKLLDSLKALAVASPRSKRRTPSSPLADLPSGATFLPSSRAPSQPPMVTGLTTKCLPVQDDDDYPLSLSVLGKRKVTSSLTLEDPDFEPEHESEDGDSDSDSDAYCPGSSSKRRRTVKGSSLSTSRAKASSRPPTKLCAKLKKRPHACNKCHQLFTRNNDLQRHLDTTECGDGPQLWHCCNLCSVAMLRPDAVKRHHKAKHPEMEYKPRTEWRSR